MDIQNVNGYTLNNLNKINIILGKNGVGKSNKPWEIALGQTIADVVCNRPPNSEDGVQDYLGQKVVNTLISTLV